MASLVSSIIKLSLGLIVEKIRDYTAEKLKDKDFTEEDVRQVVVRELDDIKSKLDGLVRKDLLSSISSFKEGIELLYLSFGKMTENGQPKNHDTHSPLLGKPKLCMKDLQVDVEAKLHCTCFLEEIREVDLAEGIRNLNSVSRKRFEDARSSFREAREEAKRAFSNEALSTEDRILAIKLRVMSRILECLEDPEAAAVSCKVYLEELHSMSAVREILSVYFDGGMKSWFKKEKRIENVTSVALINYVVFNFAETFARGQLKLTNWPRIHLPEQSLHPIVNLETKAIAKKHEMSIYEISSLPLSDPTCPNDLNGDTTSAESNFNFSPVENRSIVAVNRKNELIVTEPGNTMDDRVKVFNRSGELELAFFLNEGDNDPERLIFKPQGVATDADNNIYIVSTDKYHNIVHTLFVFDCDGKEMKKFFIQRAFYVAVNKTGDKVFIPRSCDNWRFSDKIFVYDGRRGKLLYSFDYRRVKGLIGAITISDNGHLLMADEVNHKVYVFTEAGEPVQQFKISPGMMSMGFNFLSQEIIVFFCWNHETRLQSYSRSGQLLGTLPLREIKFQTPAAMSVSPNGRVVLVHDGEAYLI